MLQRDVADRLTARPVCPAYGSSTVVVALRMRARRAFLLEPRAFYPRPRVDSAVVELVAHPQPPVAVGDERFLLQVVRAAFAYRRKTIANSLAPALSFRASKRKNVWLPSDTTRRFVQNNSTWAPLPPLQAPWPG